MVDVSFHCHLERASQRLEDTFYLVVLILALSLDVEVHLCCIAQALEEMLEHLRWHFSHLLTMELSIPNQPWSATEVKCHLSKAIVHRQTIAITFDASFVAQGLQEAFTQGDARVLDSMMFVHVEVALGVNRQVHHAVLAYLLQHVVEESQTSGDVTLARTIQVHLDIDVGLLGGSLHFGDTVTSEEYLCYLVPVHAVLAKNEALATEILSELSVAFTVTDHITACQVILWVVDVFGEHSCARLATTWHNNA